MEGSTHQIWLSYKISCKFYAPYCICQLYCGIVHWYCTLVSYTGIVHWYRTLVPYKQIHRSVTILYMPALQWYCSWYHTLVSFLVSYTGIVHWYHTLVTNTGNVHWYRTLSKWTNLSPYMPALLYIGIDLITLMIQLRVRNCRGWSRHGWHVIYREGEKTEQPMLHLGVLDVSIWAV